MKNILARVSTMRHKSDRQRREWDAGGEARARVCNELLDGLTITIQDESRTRIARFYRDSDDIVRVTVTFEDDGVFRQFVSERRFAWLHFIADYRWYVAANEMVKKWTGISINEAQEKVRQRNAKPRGV